MAMPYHGNEENDTQKRRKIAKTIKRIENIAKREQSLRSKQENTKPVDGYERVLKSLSHPFLGYDRVDKDKSPSVSPKTQIFVDEYHPDDETLKLTISDLDFIEDESTYDDDEALLVQNAQRPVLNRPLDPKFRFLDNSFNVEIEIPTKPTYSFNTFNPPNAQLPKLLEKSRYDYGIGERNLPLPRTTMMPPPSLGVSDVGPKLWFTDEDKEERDRLPGNSVARPRFSRKKTERAQSRDLRSPVFLGEQQWNTSIIQLSTYHRKLQRSGLLPFGVHTVFYEMDGPSRSSVILPTSRRTSLQDHQIMTLSDPRRRSREAIYQSHQPPNTSIRANTFSQTKSNSLPHTPAQTPNASPRLRASTPLLRPKLALITPVTSPTFFNKAISKGQQIPRYAPYTVAPGTSAKLREQITPSAPTSPTPPVTYPYRVNQRETEANNSQLEFAQTLLDLASLPSTRNNSTSYS